MSGEADLHQDPTVTTQTPGKVPKAGSRLAPAHNEGKAGGEALTLAQEALTYG